MILHRIHELGKSCGGPGLCGHQEWCSESLCEGHPDNLRWPVAPMQDRPEVTPEEASGWTAKVLFGVIVCVCIAAAVAMTGGVK